MAKDTLKSMIVLFGYILVIAFLRGPNAQLPALIGELCFMQCVDFTGAAFIVVAVLLEVPNLFCVAIVSNLRIPPGTKVMQRSLGWLRRQRRLNSIANMRVRRGVADAGSVLRRNRRRGLWMLHWER